MPAFVTSNSGRFARVGALALTVLVFGATVGVVTLRLRADLREQILRREADTLAAVASMQLEIRAEQLGLPLDEVPGVLYVEILKMSKLQGVSGVRVFDVDGKLSDAWMMPPTPSISPSPEWAAVMGGEAMGRLHRNVKPDTELEVPLVTTSATLLEAWTPLRRGQSSRVIGAAQFWVDGTALENDLAAHDRRLWMQAILAWLGGSLVIAAGLRWALRRLDEANRKLAARSEDLQRANRELVLAAKTSALGAVTAHLMHELKNPLAGLETIVAGQRTAERPDEGGELAAASELTRRLRTMVNDVVGVLRDEQSGAEFELTAEDVVSLVQEKVRGDAATRDVRLEVRAPADVTLSGRRANLATLVLRNLLQNAVEATPAGGRVRLTGRALPDGAIEFLVEDEGGGLPDTVRTRLFQPCVSTKAGGSGLGLALSAQIAQQAGGRLELVRSDERGTSFRLVLNAEA